jgi:hypothetical protein
MEVRFVKLTSDSLCENGLQDEYSVLLSLVIFQNNPSQCTSLSLSLNVDFCPLLLFPGTAFPSFMYANITLETVTLDSPNNVAVFVTHAPAPLSKLDKSPIF